MIRAQVLLLGATSARWKVARMNRIQVLTVAAVAWEPEGGCSNAEVAERGRQMAGENENRER
jgi:hypothetical protein